MSTRRAKRRKGSWRTKLAWTLRLGLIASCLVLVGLTLVPSVLGYQRYVITGTSMTGTIDKGSIAYDRVVPVSKLRVGDVITYNPPPGSTATGSLVTHRLISMTKGDDGRVVYQTKGDHNAVPDPWVFHLDDPRQAVVAFRIPDAGYVLAALSIRWVRMTIVGVLAGLIVLRVGVALWAEAGAGRRDDGVAADADTLPADIEDADAPDADTVALEAARAAALLARIATNAAATSSREFEQLQAATETQRPPAEGDRAAS